VLSLAAVVAITARDSGDLAVAFQLLIYPATDQHRSHPSHAENGQGYLLTSDTMAYFTGHYLPDRARSDDWRASPLLHPDLSNLPRGAGADRRLRPAARRRQGLRRAAHRGGATAPATSASIGRSTASS